MKLVTLSVLASALVFVACSKPEDAGAPEPIKRAKVAAPAANTASTAAAAADSIGVAECDTYLKNYSDCVSNKVPAASRAALKTSLDQTRDAWRKAAADANGKAALATACKQMTETARVSMKAYGCTF